MVPFTVPITLILYHLFLHSSTDYLLSFFKIYSTNSDFVKRCSSACSSNILHEGFESHKVVLTFSPSSSTTPNSSSYLSASQCSSTQFFASIRSRGTIASPPDHSFCPTDSLFSMQGDIAIKL